MLTGIRLAPHSPYLEGFEVKTEVYAQGCFSNQ